MALSEHCLPAHSLNLKGVPRRGEQCPVENNSYKGYSPPKCTCNAISHIQVKTYTFLLKCLHAMDENVTHPVPCPESSPTPSHMHMPSVKTVIYVPSMTIFFQNKNFLCYKQNSFDLSKSRVFIHLWATDFRFFTAGRRTPFRNFYRLSPLVIMSNRN